VRAAGSRIRRDSRYISKTVIQRVKHLVAGSAPAFVDDRTLLDRVESELFVDPTIPRGPLNLEVEGATVVLRGQLTSRAEIERVEAAVRQVPGVWQVRSLLHVPGTPAPNKLAALRASSAAVADERWPEEPPPDVDSEASNRQRHS
jgi:hypothetical protein